MNCNNDYGAELSRLLFTTSILIVEDDAQFRESLVRTLSAAGCETVAEATNGNGAIQLATALHFDLLITDLVMPEVEGMELILWFRKAQPDTKIIAMSAALQGSCLPVAQLLGATAVLHKPFTGDVLLDTVRNVLSPERLYAVSEANQTDIVTAGTGATYLSSTLCSST